VDWIIRKNLQLKSKKSGLAQTRDEPGKLGETGKKWPAYRLAN